MELIILDKDFKPVAPTRPVLSLIWNRRYREPGTFELHVGVDDAAAVRSGAYLYRSDRDELGLIQQVDIKRDDAGARSCGIKGYFAEALLDDRVLDRTQRLDGTPEAIARELVRKHFIDTEGAGDYDGRSIAGRLTLDELSGEEQETIRWQGTGSALGSALYALEADQGLSHRVRYDYLADQLRFGVWRGKDRGALFSERLGSLTDGAYHKDITDAPNVVYVAGSGEGTSRKVYLLDLRKEGEAAREMYVDARDLQQDYTGEDGQSYHYTDEDYDALLEARGRQKAAEHQAQERCEVSVEARAALVYQEDYDLGDVCSVEIDGIEMQKRITGIREIYEPAKHVVEVTFGDYGPVSFQVAVSRQAQINEATAPPTANVGDLSKLETKDKSGIVPAVNELDRDIGDLSELSTEAKGSLVDAINEIARSGGTGGGGESGEDQRIGDMSKLTTTAKSTVVAAINELDKDIGDLANLETTVKGSLVYAINELAGKMASIPMTATFAERPNIIIDERIIRTISSGQVVIPTIEEGSITATPTKATISGHLNAVRTALGSMATKLYIPPKDSFSAPRYVPERLATPVSLDYTLNTSAGSLFVRLDCQLAHATRLSPEQTGKPDYLVAYYPIPLGAAISGGVLHTITTIDGLTRLSSTDGQKIGYGIKLGDAFSLDAAFATINPTSGSEHYQAWMVFDTGLHWLGWAKLKVRAGSSPSYTDTVISCEEVYYN